MAYALICSVELTEPFSHKTPKFQQANKTRHKKASNNGNLVWQVCSLDLSRVPLCGPIFLDNLQYALHIH